LLHAITPCCIIIDALATLIAIDAAFDISLMPLLIIDIDIDYIIDILLLLPLILLIIDITL
jgi:hypothetical protein